MISIEREERIRAALRAGEHWSIICDREGVSRPTVYTIRAVIECINKLDARLIENIKQLLILETPEGAIEQSLCVPIATIQAVKRWFYMGCPEKRRQPGENPRPCPACGNIIFPKHELRSIKYDDITLTGLITNDDIIALYRIADEVVELGNERIIANPLFYDLLQRSKATLEKVSGKKLSKAAG